VYSKYNQDSKIKFNQMVYWTFIPTYRLYFQNYYVHLLIYYFMNITHMKNT
jgi:hypothetical protein